MKWIIAIATSVVLNAFLILWGRGSFLAAIISLGSSFWIGLPVLILSAVFFSIAARKNNPRFMSISTSGIAVAAVIFSTILSIPIGSRLGAHETHKAKAFCEALVPRMEEIRSQTGAYPRDLSNLLDGLRPPSLFEPKYFHCDGTNFNFTIVDPGSIIGGWSYESTTKKWHYWD